MTPLDTQTESPRLREATQVSTAPELDFEDRRLFASVHGRLFGSDIIFQIARYRIVRRLGAGAMGVVYLARDEDLDRPVAIKLVHAHLAGPDFADRLRREARALARLAHPSAVHVYEVSEFEGQVFLAMEYVEGQSLRAWAPAARTSWRQILDAYLQAGRGLAAAHGVGLTHRDFKPDNVLRREDGRVLVVDFGLASVEGEAPGALEQTEPGTQSLLDSMFTQAGEIRGTPAYMPAEQFLGRPVDARADQFAFCVALYEGLWADRPFPEASIQARLDAIIDDGPRPPGTLAGVSRAVWTVLRRGLAHQAEARWPNMEALLEALEAAAGRSRRRRRWGAASLSLGLTAALGVGVGVFGTRPEVAPSCEADAAGAVERSWGPQARVRVARALAATELGFGETSRRTALSALDAWTQRWREARVELCELGRLGAPEVSRRRACFEAQRAQFAALVEVFATTDASTLHAVVPAVYGLPDPRACTDEAVELRPGPPLAPATSEAAVRTLSGQLAHVEALVRSARYAEARAAVGERMPAIVETHYEPLHAQALALRGRAELSEGALEEGFASLLLAADLAEGAHDDQTLASAWRFLALFAMLEARDLERGREWLRRAEASAKRVGVDPVRSGELATIRGHGHLLENNGEAAQREFEMAVADLEARGRPLRTVDALGGLGEALVRQGELEGALTVYARAQASAAEHFGRNHPNYGARTYDLGATLLSLGRSEGAEAQLRVAAEVWGRSYAQPHPNLGNAHILLTSFALADDRIEEAAREAEAATAVYRATRPAGHVDLGDAASARGAVAFAQGHFAQARADLDETIEIYTASLGTDDPYLAKVRADRGWCLIALGQPLAAIADFMAADVVLRADPDLAAMRESSLLGLAWIELREGRAQRALTWLDEAAVEGQASEASADYHLWRGLAHLQLEHPKLARQHLGLAQPALAEARRIHALAPLEFDTEALARMTGPQPPPL